LPCDSIREYYRTALHPLKRLKKSRIAKCCVEGDILRGWLALRAVIQAPIENQERKMKKAIAGAVLALAVTLVTPLVSARSANKAPSPAPSPSQVVLSQWNEIGRKLIAMAEDFPEDKYDFKPTPAQRTFAEQLLHASSSMYYFTDPAQGQKPRYPEDPKRDGLKTKAEIVAFTKKCIDDGAAVIKSKGDKGMSEWVTDPESKQQLQISDLAYGLTEHSGEHYGQLVVYYRVAGLVPPESRPKK
jgi:DinB superfamily